MRAALCPGTFDPITLGHVDIIERGLKIFDRVIVAVSQGSEKKTLFSTQDRVEMIEETFRGRKEVQVKTFDGLLVDLAKREGVNVLLRGLRTVSDFEYEVRMAAANRFMSGELETLFMMTDGRYSHLSSSLIREIVHFNGKVTGMVPPLVEKKLKEKIKR